jgi:hypothetical protein
VKNGRKGEILENWPNFVVVVKFWRVIGLHYCYSVFFFVFVDCVCCIRRAFLLFVHAFFFVLLSIFCCARGDGGGGGGGFRSFCGWDEWDNVAIFTCAFLLPLFLFCGCSCQRKKEERTGCRKRQLEWDLD